MKKYIVILISLIVVIIGVGVYASNTSNDPIISLSYFEKELSSFKKDIEKLIDKKIDESLEESSQTPTTPVTTSSKYEIVNVEAGKTVTFSESAEFIIRRGTANIVDPSKQNGIPNLTTGKDDANNAKAGLQQLYLVPRDDGRGIVAKTDLIIMVRGGYKIK